MSMRAISSAASSGMIPRRPWTTASARSNSRYFAVRLSSDHTRRMASVEERLRKMRESTIGGAMGGGPPGNGKKLPPRARHDGLRAHHPGAIDHAPVHLHGAGARGHGIEDA